MARCPPAPVWPVALQAEDARGTPGRGRVRTPGSRRRAQATSPPGARPRPYCGRATRGASVQLCAQPGVCPSGSETSFLTSFVSLLVPIPVISGSSPQRSSGNTLFSLAGLVGHPAGPDWGKGGTFVSCGRQEGPASGVPGPAPDGWSALAFLSHISPHAII